MKTIRSIFEEKIERTNAQLASLAAEADALRCKIAEIDVKTHELKSQLNFIYAWQSEVIEEDTSSPDDGAETDSAQPDEVAPDVEPETEDSHTLPVDALNESQYAGFENPTRRNHVDSYEPVVETEPSEPRVISNLRYLEPVPVGVSESGQAQSAMADFADLRLSKPASVAVAELRHAEPIAVEDAEDLSVLPPLLMPVQDFAVVSSYGDDVPLIRTRATESESGVRETVPRIPLAVFKRQSPASLNISDIARIIMRRAERES